MSIGTIAQATWSPDGRQFAVAGTALRINDAITYQQVASFENNNFDYAVDWNSDGTLLLSANYDGDIRLWDMNTHQLRRTIASTGVEMWDARFSPDDTLIAAALTDGSMRVWDVETGRLIHRNDVNGVVTSVDWSPDGSQIAFGWTGNEGTVGDVQLVPAPELTTARQVLISDYEGVLDVAWSPDGERIALITDNRIWILTDTLEEIIHLDGHSNDVYGISWSPDGLRLASASRDVTVRIWDVDEASPSFGTTLETMSFVNEVTQVAWSPAAGSNLLVTAEITGEQFFSDVAHIFWAIHVWDLSASTSEPIYIYTDYRDISGIRWSPDGSRFAFTSFQGGDDGHVVYVWHEGVVLSLAGFMSDINSISWNAAGNQLVIGIRCCWLELVDVSDTAITYIDRLDHAQYIDTYSVDWSSQNLIASSHDDDVIRFWYGAIYLLMGEIHVDGVVYIVRWHPDGIRLASIVNGQLRIWHLNDIQRVPLATPIP